MSAVSFFKVPNLPRPFQVYTSLQIAYTLILAMPCMILTLLIIFGQQNLNLFNFVLRAQIRFSLKQILFYADLGTDLFCMRNFVKIDGRIEHKKFLFDDKSLFKKKLNKINKIPSPTCTVFNWSGRNAVPNIKIK